MVTLKYQERFKTDKGVFDEFTKRNLFELESRDIYEEPLIPIKVGKESNVFVAKKGKKNIIVKIYRLQNCDFNRMYEYIRQDPRYDYLKSHKRQIIFAWTQREYKNIHKAYQAKINVPKPIKFMQNILIEEMVGKGEPANPLKDQDPADPLDFFNQTIEQIEKLYIAGLVHGDLSSFNILNDNEKPVLIDFSQSTLTKTPNSRELLKRDIENVCKYFRKLGVKNDPEEVYNKIMQDKDARQLASEKAKQKRNKSRPVDLE